MKAPLALGTSQWVLWVRTYSRVFFLLFVYVDVLNASLTQDFDMGDRACAVELTHCGHWTPAGPLTMNGSHQRGVQHEQEERESRQCVLRGPLPVSPPPPFLANVNQLE